MSLPQLNSAEGLPSSPHTEVAILGAMLLGADAVSDAIAKHLRSDDFSLDSHQRIHRAILAVADLRRDPEEDITLLVREHLNTKRELESAGGYDYLLHLGEGIPRRFNIESYVRIVKEKAMLRRLVSIGHEASVRAADISEDPREVATDVLEQLRELQENDESFDIPSVGEWFATQGEPEAMFEKMTTLDGVDLGWPQLHALTMGPQRGELWIVAARPSMGKTAWMCNAHVHTSVKGSMVTYAGSYEQRKMTIVRRDLSSMARVDAREIRSGSLRSEDRYLILERRRMLEQAPLFIDDRPGQTVSQIRARTQRLKRRMNGRLDIVFVDQLSKVSTRDSKERDLRLRIGEQTGAFKLMAQELRDVPVILFNQIKRPDGKGSSRPVLSDLKESGNIEEDADVVDTLHRPEYYDKTDESLRGVAEMIVAKDREGETKTLSRRYDGRILRWEDDYTPAAEQKTFDREYRSAYRED